MSKYSDKHSNKSNCEASVDCAFPGEFLTLLKGEIRWVCDSHHKEKEKH